MSFAPTFSILGKPFFVFLQHRIWKDNRLIVFACKNRKNKTKDSKKLRIFCASQVFDVSCHHSLKTKKLGKKGLCITFRIYISKIICTPTSLKESTCHPVLLFAWQCHKRFCFFKPPKLNLHSFFCFVYKNRNNKGFDKLESNAN